MTAVCSRYQGHVRSSLIVGGTDVTGAHLYGVYPHGSYDKLPYVTMGTSSSPRCLHPNASALGQQGTNTAAVTVCVCVCVQAPGLQQPSLCWRTDTKQTWR